MFYQFVIINTGKIILYTAKKKKHIEKSIMHSKWFKHFEIMVFFFKNDIKQIILLELSKSIDKLN